MTQNRELNLENRKSLFSEVKKRKRCWERLIIHLIFKINKQQKPIVEHMENSIIFMCSMLSQPG